MARMHILIGSGSNLYSVVVHTSVPAGNNAAGVLWQTALANSGVAVTNMPIGDGPGQITQTEADQVAAGQLLETQFQWQNDPTWTNQQRQSDLTFRAQQAVDQAADELQQRLKFFGMTVA